MIFNQRENKILNHLLKNKDRTWIIIQYNSSSEELERIEQKFEEAQKKSKNFVPTFALADNCNILYNGRAIDHCSQMHEDEPSDNNWLQIEDSCLLCLVYQNSWDLKSPITELSEQLANFFGRTPGALVQRIHVLLRRNRKPLYLSQHVWEQLKK